MKKISLLILGLFLVTITSFAQSDRDAILGDWYNEEKDAVIKIYKENGLYHGKITWMLNPLDENGKPKTDPLNPDESLKSRPRLGMVIMYDFKYERNSEYSSLGYVVAKWADGNIYDPKSGKEYSGSMTLASKNRLDLRGYVGVPIFGRTSKWSRKLD